jgi:hypothetical protein
VNETETFACDSLIPFTWHEQIRCELSVGHSGDHWCEDTGWENETSPDSLELSLTERIVVDRFEAGEPAPESFVQQHRSDGDCFCGPVQHPSGAWDHR